MSSRPLKQKASAKAPTDPRRRRGFTPEWLPLCNGGEPPPPGATDTVSRRQIEFLTAYYDLNVLYAELEAVRRRRGDAQKLLQKVSAALRWRDQLEDLYAPEGFLGEPEMDGLVVRNVKFSHARAHMTPPEGESSFSLFVPLVLPKGLTLRSYINRELGRPGPRKKKPAPGGH